MQSERNASGLYLKYAKQLVEQGDAYYCFCDKERLESLKTSVSDDGTDTVSYTHLDVYKRQALYYNRFCDIVID